ncbi:helix-turn-helix domain-containing protein [Streptomyces sp. NBC_00669]|uniref:PucR family transcriptional regulator n=1 Tax=unclassified Streptomyces TaxID=2593676 RepID=UPI002E31C60C|nr:helix-turn-helix domain-containing protein [Streptomyces sp. NBC_00669]
MPSTSRPSSQVTGSTARDEPAGTTLRRLREHLGPLVLQVECAPQSEDVLIGRQVVHDLCEPVPGQADGVLLVVGGSPEREDCLDAIRQAGAARYSAVVVKTRGGDLAAATAVAGAAGVALLVIPDDMPWRHFDALVTAATSASGPAQDTYTSIGMGDLFPLANAIAYQVGGAITIEDPLGHVLAYSNLPHQEIDEIRRQGILGRQTPDRPTNLDEYHRVIRADRPVRFDIPDTKHVDRLAVAVRAGPQLLGLLWALDGNPPLGEGAETALEEAAKVTALHLLRARSHRDPDRWSRGEALASLLDGAVSGRTAAAQLGIAEDTTSTVVAFAQAAPEEMPGLGGARIVDLVGLYCEAWHPQALCTTTGGLVYALLPTRTDAGAERRVVKFAENVVSTVQRSAGLALRVGIGVPAARLGEVPAGRRIADRVLRALAGSAQAPTIATVTDVRSRVTLMELTERGAPSVDLPPGPVQRIIEHDAQHSTTYAQSLLAYLDAFGEAIPAAARLAVHENTLRYRVRRIQELFDLDLDDPDTRLVVWLQLRLHQISG